MSNMSYCRFYLFLLSFLIAAMPALAQDRMVISETNIWPEPGQISFTDPSNDCRFIGFIDRGETIPRFWFTNVTWQMTINMKICGDIQESMSASVRPAQSSEVRSSGPLLRAGQQAILTLTAKPDAWVDDDDH